MGSVPEADFLEWNVLSRFRPPKFSRIRCIHRPSDINTEYVDLNQTIGKRLRLPYAAFTK